MEANKKKNVESNITLHGSNNVLVCLSSASSNETVIQTAAKLAKAFGLGLIAIYVETSSKYERTQIYKESLSKNMKLVEELGGRIVTVYGDNIALQIGEYTRASGIKKVVIGRTKNKKSLGRGKSYVDQLLQQGHDLELYIIPDSRKDKKVVLKKSSSIKVSLKDILKTLMIIVSTSLIGLLFQLAGFSDANIITVYIMGVLFTSLWTNGRIYGIMASLINVIIFNLFFTEPMLTLRAYESGYPVTFLVMLVASVLTSSLALKVKIQAREVARKAYRTEILLESSRILQKLENRNDIIAATALQLNKLLNTTIVYYEICEDELGEPKVIYEDGVEERSNFNIEDGLIAKWVHEHNKMAGAYTDNYSESKFLYLSIRGLEDSSLGVIGVYLEEDDIQLFEKNIMIGILDESGIIIERQLLNQQKKEIELRAKQEELRGNVLRSISHDLRTPLTSILGNAAILRNKELNMNDVKRMELYTDIYDDTTWLIQLVENLLSVTKVENGALSLYQKPELIEEVIYEAMMHLDRRSLEHTISYETSNDLLMGIMDARLIVQVIINLVNNAIKYSGEGTDIKIGVTEEDGIIKVGVYDNGIGIGKKEKEQLFHMFYTVDNNIGDSRRGLGLGLFLCKGIIDAHGGKLWVEDNKPRGCIFYFTLQKSEVNGIE